MKFLVSLFAGVSILFMSFTVLAAASNNGSSYKDSKEDSGYGEIVFKYTAPDMNWKDAPQSELEILLDIGWNFDGDVPVLYKTLSDFKVEEASGFSNEHEGHAHNEMGDSHDNVESLTVSVDGKETLVEDGYFKVESKDTEVEVFIENYGTTKAVKNNDGIYQVLIEVNLSEYLDSEGEKVSDDEVMLMHDHIYSPPPHGTKVYQYLDKVHCNRFNGPNTDHKHYDHMHWRTYINFDRSDCDWAVSRFYCSIVNDDCNTSTTYHRGWCSTVYGYNGANGHNNNYHAH